MAVAPPGAEPQTAVVPGRTLKRLMNQPRKLDAASVASDHAGETAANRRGRPRRSPAKWMRRSGSRRSPGLRRSAGLGTRTVAPLVPAMMAASIGPISSAAGKPGQSERTREKQRDEQQRRPLGAAVQLLEALGTRGRRGRFHAPVHRPGSTGMSGPVAAKTSGQHDNARQPAVFTRTARRSCRAAAWPRRPARHGW